ncbi:hypothetical protein I6L35_20845 (plasmid) [Aeromonas sp. FDAARGOS 1405]|uniref:DUF5983 family protein n=1 Tax=Aeromonas TaxID=642 RepID=UPI001C24DFDE|nr:hypothetical protein [Aeromonas sp. FDAARGOS 1405]QXB31736.1 hypothetical protein I6L35_20845 [Aeromonas sp. FDAARGOS 1405]
MNNVVSIPHLSELEISVLVTVSTAHVSEQDSVLLNELSAHELCHGDKHDCLGFLFGGNYGWIIKFSVDSWPGRLAEKGISEGAISNLKNLAAAGAQGVIFDQDADRIDGLIIFEW